MNNPERLTKQQVPLEAQPVFNRIMHAMNAADEIGGPQNPDDYITMMDIVIAEANERKQNALALRRQLIEAQPGRAAYAAACAALPNSLHRSWAELSQAARDTWNEA